MIHIPMKSFTFLFSMFAFLMPMLLHAAEPAAEQKFDLGIESMRSQGYSVGIFIFMMIAIIVFVGIIAAFMKGAANQSMKTGEKVMFGMIVLGVILASGFAALQLLDGYLF